MEANKNGTSEKRPLPSDAIKEVANLEPEKATKIVESNAPIEKAVEKDINNIGSLKKDNNGTKEEAKTNGKVLPETKAETEEEPAQCKRIIYKDVAYNLNSTVLIRESETTNMVARIEKIVKENGDPKHPTWPMIEVTWYP